MMLNFVQKWNRKKCLSFTNGENDLLLHHDVTNHDFIKTEWKIIETKVCAALPLKKLNLDEKFLHNNSFSRHLLFRWRCPFEFISGRRQTTRYTCWGWGGRYRSWTLWVQINTRRASFAPRPKLAHFLSYDGGDGWRIGFRRCDPFPCLFYFLFRFDGFLYRGWTVAVFGFLFRRRRSYPFTCDLFGFHLWWFFNFGGFDYWRGWCIGFLLFFYLWILSRGGFFGFFSGDVFHRCNNGCWFIVHTYLAFIVLNAITLFEVGRINSIQGYYKFGLLLQRLFFPESVKGKIHNITF